MTKEQYMANKNIASLVGHAFGDGNIHKNKFYFIYTNSNKQLRERVTEIITKEFEKISVNKRMSGKNIPQLQFSAKVGRELIKSGARAGSKVRQITEIPKWIMKGNKEIKVAFLSAIFDDDGYFRNTKNCRMIVIKFSKIIQLEKKLNSLLRGVSLLLKDIGIKTSDVKQDQKRINSRNETIISKRIWITKKENFIKFKKEIPIFHPQKINKLDSMCS